MKNTLIACGVAATFALAAGAAMATPLNPGLYTLTMSGGGSSDQEGASITGTGGSRQLEFNGRTVPVTLSGTSLSSSSNLSGYALSLSGSTTTTGASGTFHLTHNGHVGNGTFALAPRSANAPRMQRSSVIGEAYDDIIAWFSSWLDVGATSGPALPGTGSGSTPGHLATYHPPQ